jgi:S-adenosylmethionine hydrolase
MPVITLTTDFGLKDHFVGVVKGTILNELDSVKIVDISHQVNPFHIQECAYILKNAYKAFPPGTIHIVGVDAEKTPEKTHLAIKVDDHYFITADNGVIGLVTDVIKPEKIVEINLPNVENGSFPVLDVFVKVACHLARGGTLDIIGKPVLEWKMLKEYEPRVNNNNSTIVGSVIYIDNYGNVVTNITKSLFESYRKGRTFTVEARNKKINEIYNKYSDLIRFDLPPAQRRRAGDLLALFNSNGYLELSIYMSNPRTIGGASTLLGLDYRDTVLINFNS